MVTIKAFAYLNELTKDVTNDYYLLPEIRGTLYMADIIKRLADKEIATKNVNGEAFVELFIEECILALLEGYNVVTPLFRASISIQGVIYSYDLGHPVSADRLNVSINLAQGDKAREAIKKISVEVHKEAGSAAPVIQSVMHPNKQEPDIVYTGKMVLIRGLNIALRGSDPSVGVLFTPMQDDDRSVIESLNNPAPVFISPEDISPNTNTKLQFTLPSGVTAGKWTMQIVTQASNNNKQLRKEALTVIYPQTITVV